MCAVLSQINLHVRSYVLAIFVRNKLKNKLDDCLIEKKNTIEN